MNTAWKAAQDSVARLPRDATWSFTITDLEDDAVLNIYADEDYWDHLRELLGLTREPVEQAGDSMTWYNGGLALSLIHPEEHDGLESERHTDPTY
jgi:hypothetical protein